MNMGAPQDSVRIPLIYLLSINNLPCRSANSKVFIYVDDTCVVITNFDKIKQVDKIGAIINEFDVWCTANKLMINNNKIVIRYCFMNKYIL